LIKIKKKLNFHEKIFYFKGKTAVFLVPIIANILGRTNDCFPSIRTGIPQAPRVIIISPTRELSSQIANHARQLSIDTPLLRAIKLVYG
jgi:superfamily II DNA/RNA helicase